MACRNWSPKKVADDGVGRGVVAQDEERPVHQPHRCRSRIAAGVDERRSMRSLSWLTSSSAAS